MRERPPGRTYFLWYICMSALQACTACTVPIMHIHICMWAFVRMTNVNLDFVTLWYLHKIRTVQHKYMAGEALCIILCLSVILHQLQSKEWTKVGMGLTSLQK